jgi:hypothetical protein
VTAVAAAVVALLNNQDLEMELRYYRHNIEKPFYTSLLKYTSYFAK